jgi:hypothetical protein
VNIRTLFFAASLAAALVSGCADLNAGSPSAGATASAPSDSDGPGNPQSPYPAVTDRGLF